MDQTSDKKEELSTVGSMSPGDFIRGVTNILVNLKLPSIKAVFTNFIRVLIVTSISIVLFSIIDSLVAPIAKFLLNG